MKSKMSILTIVLIFISLFFIYSTYISYSWNNFYYKLYNDDLNKAPYNSGITSTSTTDQKILLIELEISSRMNDLTSQNEDLSYYLNAHSNYLQNGTFALIFILLSIFSWKFDNSKKLKNG